MMIVICRSYNVLVVNRGSRNQLHRIFQKYLFNEMQHAGGTHLIFLNAMLRFVDPGGPREQIC
jgi:hypothetical protein